MNVLRSTTLAVCILAAMTLGSLPADECCQGWSVGTAETLGVEWTGPQAFLPLEAGYAYSIEVEYSPTSLTKDIFYASTGLTRYYVSVVRPTGQPARGITLYVDMDWQAFGDLNMQVQVDPEWISAWGESSPGQHVRWQIRSRVISKTPISA